MFLALSIFMQTSIIYGLIKEENVMDLFEEQINLCDFGASKDGSSIGPDGTATLASRTYTWEEWIGRKFVKDSLLKLFPEKASDIDQHVDAGEYGLQSYRIRQLCCFLFVMAVTRDFYTLYELMMLLYYVPTAGESWMEDVQHGGRSSVRLPPSAEIMTQHVKLKIAGMPLFWKGTSLIVIMIKAGVWWFTASSGITFLMETSDIVDMVINSVALTFILDIDVMIFETVTSPATRYMMDALEDFHIQDVDHDAPDDEELELKRFDEGGFCQDFPRRLLLVCCMCAFFMGLYYFNKCQWRAGYFISLPMKMPKTANYGLQQVFFPHWFPIDTEDDFYWQLSDDV